MGDTNKILTLQYNYSKNVSAIGMHTFAYGWWGGRLTQVGPFALSYDRFKKEKIIKIGEHTLEYGLQGRLNKVGDLDLRYGPMSGRLNSVGDFQLQYGIKGRLNQIGDYKLEYGFWGRLNGIHLLGDTLTDEKLLVFFIVIRLLQQEEKASAEQAERERQAKLILDGKAKLSSVVCGV